MIDLRPETHAAFSRGHAAVQDTLAALSPAEVPAARAALISARDTYAAAGDREGEWQAKGALRALRDHMKENGR